MIALLIVQPFIIMLLGMIGGQGFLQARRFILPVLATLVGVIWHLHRNEPWWQPLPLIALIGILVQGYGEKSWINKWLKVDWEDRLLYSLLVWIPVFVTAVLCHNIVVGVVALVALIAAFQIRAGKLFSIGKFDVLIEDIIRYLTLGIACSAVVA